MSNTKTIVPQNTFVSHAEPEQKISCKFSQQETIKHDTVYSKKPENYTIKVLASNKLKHSISYNVLDEKSREFYDIINKKLEVK